MNNYGTREEVWLGQAYMTKGGLAKRDLMISKKDKIVSVVKHNIGKKLLKYTLREKLCPPICTEIRKAKYHATQRKNKED
jgi:hypothetical protein